MGATSISVLIMNSIKWILAYCSVWSAVNFDCDPSSAYPDGQNNKFKSALPIETIEIQDLLNEYKNTHFS